MKGHKIVLTMYKKRTFMYTRSYKSLIWHMTFLQITKSKIWNLNKIVIKTLWSKSSRDINYDDKSLVPTVVARRIIRQTFGSRNICTVYLVFSKNTARQVTAAKSLRKHCTTDKEVHSAYDAIVLKTTTQPTWYNNFIYT